MHEARALSGLPHPATYSCALQQVVEALLHRQDCLLLQCWHPNDDLPDTPNAPSPWSEEEIVFLHWRLLQEVVHLADPE